jgi:hypothetical protein
MLKKNDLVEVVALSDDPHAVPVGTRGRVSSVNRYQADVVWDNGALLMLALPEDLSVVRVVK